MLRQEAVLRKMEDVQLDDDGMKNVCHFQIKIRFSHWDWESVQFSHSFGAVLKSKDIF